MTEEREGKIVTIVQPEHGLGEMPENLAEAIEWLKSKLDMVPEEYKNAVTIEIESESDWDYHHPTLSIHYVVPESDEEMARRLKRQDEGRRRAAERQKERELRLLAELQKKYGAA